MGKDNYNAEKLNKDNHSVTHILLTICFLLILVDLWFSINTYFMIQNQIDVQSGRVNRSKVYIIENE